MQESKTTLEAGNQTGILSGYIDAHQHFWNYDPEKYKWITDDMSVIQKSFLPADLYPILQANGVEGCIAVQTDQSEVENEFLLKLASENNFIKAIVGWVNLQAENIDERLDHYSQYHKMKGFRHILQGEADRALMLKPAFKKGIELLELYGYTYDILIFPDQLKYAQELVEAYPAQLFVLDHLAKPYIKDKKIDDWKKEIKAIAKYENLFCKISGMVTEADWHHWNKADFTPYLDVVVEAFGTKRIMFGSDWPVCLVAASYEEMMDIVKEYFSSYSQSEQDDFFRHNAVRFYNL